MRTTMKKNSIRIIIVIILVLCVIALAYCLFTDGELTDEVWVPIGSVKRISRKTDMSVDDLTAYDYEEFKMFKLRSRFHIFPGFSSESYFLQHYHEPYPIEKMKLIDSDTLSVIYKLCRDDGTEILLSMIFKRDTKFFSFSDGVNIPGKYEKWKKTGEFYFLTEKLSLSDFENIDVGDTLDEVNLIDKGVSCDAGLGYNYYDDSKFEYINGVASSGAILVKPDDVSSITINSKPKFTSFRLLSDGIVVIQFEAEESGDVSNYRVSSIDFYSYSDELPKYVTVQDKKLVKWIFE